MLSQVIQDDEQNMNIIELFELNKILARFGELKKQIPPCKGKFYFAELNSM